ncbi:hypothetical protein L1987_76723 [Smallanthus sonchifolius]|uniref:Uncharacterized protein n=1 Tax=Smallanthus sonchifolius TaxID=185202 RepID=A0ACB8Z7T1_9ASTR|nr:hypothetical protein L1987_76723 [Smallanthus sonchifolius]
MAISRFLLISKNHKLNLMEKLVQLFAVGQNGLMALYDTLFSQGATLSNSGSLLDLRSIPIFNENNAISTRKALYEDYSETSKGDHFWRQVKDGKDSKVKVASNAAAYSGTPVVIARYHILESRSIK